MPIWPRRGSSRTQRHRKSWSSSSADGCLKAATRQPCGLTPEKTCLMALSLPAASRAWKTTSSAHESAAHSSSWASRSRSMPSASTSSAASLRSFLGTSSSPAQPGSRPASPAGVPGVTRKRCSISVVGFLVHGIVRPPRLRTLSHSVEKRNPPTEPAVATC